MIKHPGKERREGWVCFTIPGHGASLWKEITTAGASAAGHIAAAVKSRQKEWISVLIVCLLGFSSIFLFLQLRNSCLGDGSIRSGLHRFTPMRGDPLQPCSKADLNLHISVSRFNHPGGKIL